MPETKNLFFDGCRLTWDDPRPAIPVDRWHVYARDLSETGKPTEAWRVVDTVIEPVSYCNVWSGMEIGHRYQMSVRGENEAGLGKRGYRDADGDPVVATPSEIAPPPPPPPPPPPNPCDWVDLALDIQALSLRYNGRLYRLVPVDDTNTPG